MADAIHDILTAAGATVVGAANSVSTALRMIEALQIDLACLDVNLGCETSFPLADELTSRSIPFVFVTAYGANMLPPIHCARPLVSKPVDSIELVRHAASLLEGSATLPRKSKSMNLENVQRISTASEKCLHRSSAKA
jgi:CheY-like chemotaxis protein